MSDTQRLGTVGYGVGAQQSGVNLMATASPFEAIPPPIWQGFKKAVMEAARNWGLQVSISDHPSITAAQQRFWQMSRVMEDARAKADTEPVNGG